MGKFFRKYMKKVSIKQEFIEGESCYRVEITGVPTPEYFITCKKGFKKLCEKDIRLMSGDGLGYTRTTKLVRIHSLLLPVKKGFHVDHVNRNRRDNRLCNLRYVTHKDNMRNSSVKSTNKSGHKYISWSNHAKKYRLCIDRTHYGYYKTIEEAVIKRDFVLEELNHPYTL